MAPLDIAARQLGRKAMERKLTPAGKVRRQLKAGRPRKIANDPLSALDALQKASLEADRARRMMRAAGLDPDDIRVGMVYCTPQIPGYEGLVYTQWLPLPEDAELAEVFKALDKASRESVVLFLGLLWKQRDAQEPTAVMWVTQWMASPEAEKRLLAARDLAVAGGNKAQDN